MLTAFFFTHTTTYLHVRFALWFMIKWEDPPLWWLNGLFCAAKVHARHIVIFLCHIFVALPGLVLGSSLVERYETVIPSGTLGVGAQCGVLAGVCLQRNRKKGSNTIYNLSPRCNELVWKLWWRWGRWGLFTALSAKWGYCFQWLIVCVSAKKKTCLRAFLNMFQFVSVYDPLKILQSR